MQEPAATTIATGRRVTEDELFRMPDDGYRYALVRGSSSLPHRTPRRPTEPDTLDGAPLLPESRLPVGEIFAL